MMTAPRGAMLAAGLALGVVVTGCSRGATGEGARAPSGQREQTVRELIDRGRAFATIGDLTRGEQYLSAALQRGAAAPLVLPLLVHVCVEAGRYRVAAEYVRAYMLSDPDSATLRLLYGLLEAAVGDRDVALREYEAVLRLHPDNPAGHYALAVLLRDAKGDASGADAHFREYLRLDPRGEHVAEARASLLGEGP
jgi:tetratricopeptide (TPR) repeat protein